ncbi:dystrophin-like [Sycon ciliatum]|uniref:dystrophin-like n=1 Tax=Sycon ciliatum TaxID=27933 RepID=UPI0031F5F7FE
MKSQSGDSVDGGRLAEDAVDAVFTDPMDGWERAVTSNGIPYFISHGAETTTWDHPYMTKTLRALEGLNAIKYAVYRMAMKLRSVQKTAGLDHVTLACVEEALHNSGVRPGKVSWNSTIAVSDAETVIGNIFKMVKSKSAQQVMDIAQCTDLALNWVLNTYDSGRTGLLHTLSLVTGIILLCKGKLADKYQALIAHIGGGKDSLTRADCEKFLQDCLQIPRQFFESGPFGGTNVNMAIISLIEYINVDGSTVNNDDDFSVSALDVLDWLLEEPQTIVWLPTMHRLASAETVRHEAKCSSCKAYPIIGMRYRCTRCASYDLCQTCFFADKVSQKHKQTHPMKEYSMLTTSGEDVKDLLSFIKNKLSTKKRRQRSLARRKSSFLPLPARTQTDLGRGGQTTQSSGNAADVHGDIQRLRQRLVKLESATQQVNTEAEEDDHLLTLHLLGHSQEFDPEQAAELTRLQEASQAQDGLHAVIDQLNDEKRRILQELEELRASSALQTDAPDAGYLRADRQQLLDRIARLEEHNQTLEEQLRRLRELLQIPDSSTPQPAPRATQTSAQPVTQPVAQPRRHTGGDGGSVAVDMAQPSAAPPRTAPHQLVHRPSAAGVTPVVLAATDAGHYNRTTDADVLQSPARYYQPMASTEQLGLMDSMQPARQASHWAGPGDHTHASAIAPGGGDDTDLASVVAIALRDLTMPKRQVNAPTMRTTAAQSPSGQDLIGLSEMIGIAMESLSQATATTYSMH